MKYFLILFLLCELSTFNCKLTSPIKTRCNNQKNNYNVANRAMFNIIKTFSNITAARNLNDPKIKSEEVINKNFIISPLSMVIALSQTLIGATCNTRKLMQILLDFNEKNSTRKMNCQLNSVLQQLLDEGNERQVYISSALFVETDLIVKNYFKKRLRAYYNSNIKPTPFRTNPKTAIEEINTWCSQTTKGQIPIIIQSIPTSMAALVANTVHFDADWEEPFSYQLTNNGAFYPFESREKKIEVTYMNGQIEELLYSEINSLNCKFIQLPYRGKSKVTMNVILPKSSIEEIMPLINKSSIEQLIKSTKKYTTDISMPKLNVQNTITLKSYVQNMNLTNSWLSNRSCSNDIGNFIQNPFANMKRASADDRFEITDIVQHLAIKVDEKGTQASAVTAGIIDYDGFSKTFALDRPYIFFIRHEKTKAILFWGTIYNPNE